MKGIAIIIIGLMLPLASWSQKAWIVPDKFNPDDSITIYVDVSKTECTRLKDTQDDIYLWTWEPGNPVLGNGVWENSIGNNKMTRSADNPNIYYYKNGHHLFLRNRGAQRHLQNWILISCQKERWTQRWRL